VLRRYHQGPSAQTFKNTILKLRLRPIVFHELPAIFVTRNIDAGVPSNQVADLGDRLARVETYRRRGNVTGQIAAHKAVWARFSKRARPGGRAAPR
jgi:hypothetical protein